MTKTGTHDCPQCGATFYYSADARPKTAQEVLAEVSSECCSLRTELLKTDGLDVEGPFTQALLKQLLGVLSQAEALADSALLFSARERSGKF